MTDYPQFKYVNKVGIVPGSEILNQVIPSIKILLINLFRLILYFALLLEVLFPAQGIVFAAAPNLKVTPITWNVIGLDSNNVNVGPNNFPIGARVCNTGDVSATNVTGTFVWDDGQDLYDSSSYINLRTGSLSSINTGAVPPSICKDFYFEVSVTRDLQAYDTHRSYHINISSTETSTINTPIRRDIYVEHLISQNRNSTDSVIVDGDIIPAGGSMSLQVGSTYDIQLDASTATQGYNQLEDFINFPNTVFQVLSVQSHYSADSSGYVGNSNDKLYADACLWDMDPTSVSYRSCIGSDGKAGGTISTIYTIKIIGGAGTTITLGTLIYDFSGSSYHYNSDFASGIRFAVITSPLTMIKSFTPATITTSNGTSTLSISITNTSSSPVSGISLTDPLPSLVSVADGTTKSTSAGCTTPTFTAATDGTTISYAGGVAGSSTCILSVSVKASADGTYTNTTDHLFINSGDTGISASANLTKSADVISPTCGIKIAEWNMDDSTFPPSATSGTGTASAGNGITTSIDTGIGNPANSWKATGFALPATLTTGNNEYFQFSATTTGYTDIGFSFDALLDPSANGPTKLLLYSSTDSTNYSPYGSVMNPNGVSFTNYNQPFTNSANDSGQTYFRIYGYDAVNSGVDAKLYLDNISITGCKTISRPFISKGFSPKTINAGGISTLTFTLSNPNDNLITQASFSDILPNGMFVADPPSASSTCNDSVFNPLAGDKTLDFSGGSIPSGTIASPGTCTAQVNVTADLSGNFVNTSGYISANGTGVNITNSSHPEYLTDTLTVNLTPAVILKEFSPKTIPAGSSSNLTITLNNPNLGTTLTSVGFTDTLPTNLTAGTPVTTCTSGILTASSSSAIVLSGASIPAGGYCTVNVLVSSVVTNSDYTNTVSVSSSAGAGNTSVDHLAVRDAAPAITLLKQISSSPAGPWAKTINTAPGEYIYYRFTIENMGDVPLSPVWVTDPTLDVSSCSWPAVLPVGSATADPSAICVTGPVTAIAGTHSNTATAKGTYNDIVYSSAVNSASYATTSLTLVKNASQLSFTQAGDQLDYIYTVKNTGDASLTGPVLIKDSNTEVICPLISSTGDHDALLDKNESLDCTGSYIITAQDVLIGSVTNTAFASASSTLSNSTRETVYLDNPDLVVVKTNNTNNHISNESGSEFTWTLTVSNNGPVAATFLSGEKILTDTLPGSISTYNVSTSKNGVTCSKSGSKFDCTAGAGNVTIDAGESFTVNVLVTTPATTGTLTNMATVNPDTSSNFTESNTGNNNGFDSVVVTAPLPDLTVEKNNNTGGNTENNTSYDWTIKVSNAGGSDAIFTNGQKILTDILPSSGISYGAIVVDTLTGGVSGTVTCNTSTVCTASGTVTISKDEYFTVTIPATPGSTGSLVNTAVVNPDHLIVESNTGNNSQTDTVKSWDPPIITKYFGASSIISGTATTLTLILENPAGNPGDLTSLAVDDTFPSGLTLADTDFSFSPNTPSACGTITKINNLSSAAGDGAIRFKSASLAPGDTCEVVLNVTSSSEGDITNNTDTPTASGPISLTGAKDSADLSVGAFASPVITKSFGVVSMLEEDHTLLTISIENSNAGSITLSSDLVDNLPSGMSILTSGSTGSCNESDVIADQDATSITLKTNAAIPAGGCSVIVDVTSSSAGAKTNTIAAGDLKTSAGNNSIKAEDTLDVYTPPTITKVFGGTSLLSGETTTLTLTLGNPISNPHPLTDVQVDDIFPAGLSLANNIFAFTPASCGTITNADADNTASEPGDTAVRFTSGSIEPGNNCAVEMDVTSSTDGSITNTTGAPTTGGPIVMTGLTAADTLSVLALPTISKSFGTSNIASGGNISLTISIGNPNESAITLTGDLIDTLPGDITINTTGSTGTCSSDDITAEAGTNTVTLANGASIPADGCTIIVDVTSTEPGEKVNTIASGDLKTSAGNNSSKAEDTLNVYIPPTLTKSFDKDQVIPGETSTLTLTLGNPALNPGDLTSLQADDNFPSGMSLSDSIFSFDPADCGSVTNTDNSASAADDKSVRFTVDTLTSGSTCTVGINVKTTDSVTNTTEDPTAEGPVSLTGTAVSDTLDAALPLIGISKRLLSEPEKAAPGVFITSFEFVVRNYGDQVLNSVQVTDDLDAMFGSLATYTIADLSSSGSGGPDTGFNINPDFNGSTDTELLSNPSLKNTLAKNEFKTIELTLRVTPATVGPFENTATVTALDPNSNEVTDLSQDGTNPDQPADPPAEYLPDGNPTNNNEVTEFSYSASLFDPPFGIKSFDDQGLPVLHWTMVWINQTNIPDLMAVVSDPIVEGTTYIADSIECTPFGTSTVDECTFEDPSADYPRGRVLWTGLLGPDLGHKTAAAAENELLISFDVSVAAGIKKINNTASAGADLDGDEIIELSETNLATSESQWTGAQENNSNIGKGILPLTGFSPGVISRIRPKKDDEPYKKYPNLVLEIPSINLSSEIVGVPQKNGTWDTTWLGNTAGYLQGTAFPGWSGNSAITGHVYSSTGNPGLFVNLYKLAWGSKVIIHSYGMKYSYEVRLVRTIWPDETWILGHKESSWITLLTCRDFDSASSSYRMRTAVQAVLVNTEPDNN